MHLSVFISVFNQLDAQNFCFTISFISCLYMFRAHVLIIRRSKLHYTSSGIITAIGGRLVHQTATYSCDDTRGCVMQFWRPDDEHMCSKHVEAWNKRTVKQKFCASSWLITDINYTIKLFVNKISYLISLSEHKSCKHTRICFKNVCSFTALPKNMGTSNYGEKLVNGKKKGLKFTLEQVMKA